MKLFDYIICDLDGTLLDDSMRHYKCYCDIIKRYGGECISFDEYWNDKRNKVKRTVLLQKSKFEGTYEQYLDTWNEWIEDKKYLACEKLKGDTIDFLKWATAVSSHLYLATMRQNRSELLKQLQRLKIDTYFEKITTGNPYAVKKADLISLRLNEKSIVIGDTEADWELANALGCPFVAITTGLRDARYFKNNDWCIEQLSEIEGLSNLLRLPIYKVVSEVISDYDYYSYKILWNAENIIKRRQSENQSGYIVQRVQFSRNQEGHKPENLTYFEAWKVENGKCKDSGDYDDDFSNGLQMTREFANPKGTVKWEGKIYWIPCGSSVHSTVDSWKPGAVAEAGELKSAYAFPELSDSYFVADREVKKFSWG